MIERDEEAVELSRGLVQALGLEDKITIKKTDFLVYFEDNSHKKTDFLVYFEDNSHYDAVILASLLFTSGDTEELVAHLVKNIKFKNCLVRTVRGMRQLLYKKVDEKLLEKYLKPELLVDPQNHILNSILLYSHV